MAYPCRRSSKGLAQWPRTANRFHRHSAHAGCARAPGARSEPACPAGHQPVRRNAPAQAPSQALSTTCEDDTDPYAVRTCKNAFTGAARQPETDGGCPAIKQAHRHPPAQETRHERACWSIRLIETASMTAIWRRRMNTCALKSAANDGAWQPAAATGLPGRRLRRRGSILQSNVRQNVRRSGVYCFSSVLRSERDDASVSNNCEDEDFGSAAENSAGPRPASRVLVSNVLIQVASLSKYRCHCWCRSLYSSLDMIHRARRSARAGPAQRWRASGASRWAGRLPTDLALRKMGRRNIGRSGGQRFWSRPARHPRNASYARPSLPAELPQQAAQPGKVVRFGNEMAAFRQFVGSRSHFA